MHQSILSLLHVPNVNTVYPARSSLTVAISLPQKEGIQNAVEKLKFNANLINQCCRVLYINSAISGTLQDKKDELDRTMSHRDLTQYT